MEFLSQKNDASLFAFGTHSKKRPHNLVFGRLFDHHILDMVETGVAGAWPLLLDDYVEWYREKHGK